MEAKVVINQQHKLLPDQERLLNETFTAGWSRWDVPADGLTAEAQAAAASELAVWPVVIASPVPFLTARLAAIKAIKACRDALIDSGGIPLSVNVGVFIFHNNCRVAKEVPDGKGGKKVIHTVAPEGWQLLEA